MRHGTWETLYKSLTSQANSLEAHLTFNKLRKEWVELEPFDHPSALIEYFTGNVDHLDHKDELYAVLVTIAQEEGKTSLAMTLLFLGLWPGLDSAYGKKRKYYYKRSKELTADMCSSFVTVVGRADLRRINRVASTLVRNTERTLMASVKRGWKWVNRTRAIPDEDYFLASRPVRHQFGLSDLGLAPGLSNDQVVLRLQEVLTKIVGRDAELVIGSVVLGENLRELGEKLGLTHANARKRYQRALKRLHDFLQKN